MYWVGIQKSRTAAYIACGLLLVLAQVLFAVQMASAAPTYTPYANSVAAQSGLGSGSAGNAVGAPDQQYASLLGLNSTLTLDMGDGEEGTNTLKAYFGAINLQALVRVEFLDDSLATIKTEERQLFLELTPSTQTFAYDWHDYSKAYRYVRISSLVGLALGIDSVEALGFIGSSPDQDTDGDGIPDREDGGPLVFDPPANNDDDDDDNNNGGNNNGGGSGGGSNTTTTNTTRTNVTTNTRSGATVPVNAPATGITDKDGDQMDDNWELAHGLDPNNKNDGRDDTDADGLTNVKEYEFDTDPRQSDTDSDGIPDGWEVSHGLNAKVNDSEQDPDFDYITNRGEYHFDTNPYVADNFQKLAAKIDNTARLWNWFLWLLVLVIAIFAFMQAHKLVRRVKQSRPTKTAASKKRK